MRAVLPIYYGWFVLAASAVSEMLVMGATAYASGLFVLPLQAEFHISRADANSPVMLLFFGAALVSPLVGRLLDRWPIRLIVPAGALMLAVCFGAIAMAGSLWVMALLLLCLGGIALMSVGPLSTSTLASRWFHRQRGLALGLAAVATSGGGFVVVPFLSIAIQRQGWRHALFYEGLIIAAIIILVALVVLRDRPASVGLENHPENHGGSVDASESRPLPLGRILGNRAFWIPSVTIALISGTAQATVVTLPPYGLELGLSAAGVALLISAFATCAAATKILAGVLADYLNRRVLLCVAAAAMTLSWSCLSLSASQGALLASACLAGIALGFALPTVGALIAFGFGPLRFGSVMGYTWTLVLVSALASVRFVGFMFDRFAGYHQAFITFAVLLALLFLLVLLVPPGKPQA